MTSFALLSGSTTWLMVICGLGDMTESVLPRGSWQGNVMNSDVTRQTADEYDGYNSKTLLFTEEGASLFGPSQGSRILIAASLHVTPALAVTQVLSNNYTASRCYSSSHKVFKVT